MPALPRLSSLAPFPVPSAVASPLDAARSLLVLPVRALREVAVVAARTVRHWEVVLTVAAAPADEGIAPAEARPEVEVVDVTDARELPVEEWPQLSLADAQARTSACSPSDLATLLAYEQRHGHRAAFELLLQQRLRQAVG